MQPAFTSRQCKASIGEPVSRLRLLRFVFWCLAGAALLLALIPAEGPESGYPIDKLNHILAFFVLSSLARILWPGSGTLRLLMLLICFGAGIELLQLAMAVGRNAEWGDFGADVIATVAGLLFGRFLLTFRDRRAPAN